MIKTSEEYITLVESVDVGNRRLAITMCADEEVWLTVLERRPDLAADVAMNKHLPKSIVNLLVTSTSCRVRSLVAMKRSLDRAQFEQLARDEDESVRMMVAHNKKSPQIVLDLLSRDPCEGVAFAARSQLKERLRLRSPDV